MKKTLAGFALALMLAACGGGSGSSSGGGADACALIASQQAMFGAHADMQPGHGLDAMAGTCSWLSADGRRNGDIILYTTQSLHSATPASQVTTLATAWGKMTATPLAPIANLGDEAQIATDLPGYQVQIVLRKGDKVVAILAGSGDPAITSEALARQMAAAAASKL